MQDKACAVSCALRTSPMQQPGSSNDTRRLTRRATSDAYTKLTVRLTPAESEALQANARAAGISQAELIARTVTFPGIGAGMAEQVEAVSTSARQLLAIGRNLNQVARALNEFPGLMTSVDRAVVLKAAEMATEHARLAAELVAAMTSTRRSQAQAEAQARVQERKRAEAKARKAAKKD